MTKGNGSSGFDLEQLATVQTAEMVAQNPVEGGAIISYGQPLTLTIASTWHPRFRDGQVRYFQAIQNLALVWGDKQPPVEETSKATMHLWAHRVVSWTPFDFCGQKRIECTPETVALIFDHPAGVWLFDQVREFCGRREAFFADRRTISADGSATSESSPSRTKTASPSPSTGAVRRRDRASAVRISENA